MKRLLNWALCLLGRPPKGFHFDCVTAVTSTGLTEPVYDLTVKAREFAANRVVVHNCHQATWVISKSTDRSLAGHGPVWQRWMVKVGLNPSQYDNTDNAEYESAADTALKELELTKKWGPRVPPAFIKKLIPLHRKPVSGETVLIPLDGRLFVGKFTGTKFNGAVYDFKRDVADTSRPVLWSFKGVPTNGFNTP